MAKFASFTTEEQKTIRYIIIVSGTKAKSFTVSMRISRTLSAASQEVNRRTCNCSCNEMLSSSSLVETYEKLAFMSSFSNSFADSCGNDDN